jgi:D-sedoheptulose 7-phosphate isomerase
MASGDAHRENIAPPGAIGAYIDGYFRRSLVALEGAARDAALLRVIAESADAVSRCFSRSGKLLIAGNGGSAADAQHLAAEFLSRFASERRPLPALALTTDTSTLTAIGNDYGFERIFERQLHALGRPGDVFLAISTSGRSANVIAALQAARSVGMTTIGFTGQDASRMCDLCDLCLRVPSAETAVIQQVHIVAGHIVCGLVEQAMAPR